MCVQEVYTTIADTECSKMGNIGFELGKVKITIFLSFCLVFALGRIWKRFLKPETP